MAGYYPTPEYKPKPSKPCPCPSPSGTTSACDASTATVNSTVLSSGQFTLRLPLLSLDSGPCGWRFSVEHLRYNGIGGVLGPNFNFSQNVHLEKEVDGDVTLVTDDNLRERFDWNGSTSSPQYSSLANNTAATLTYSPTTDQFTLKSSKGTVSMFFGFGTGTQTPGRIKSITDRYGSSQTFVWSRPGGVAYDQLQSVTDSYGRTTLYRYFGAEGSNQLREIEDFLGRKLSFQYDEAGRLIAIVTPAITKAAEGNTFPGGTAYVFEYDASNARPERRDDLIRVWYPNQATPHIDVQTRQVDVARVYAEAVPRYTVEYGQDPTDLDTYGRVVRETVGDPNGGPGGAYSFLYITGGEDFPPNNIIDPADPIVARTVVTDRNGNQAIYDFNHADMPVRVEVFATRSKLVIQGQVAPASYVTWTKYNTHNQPLLVIRPEGNSEEYEYDTGYVPTLGTVERRVGLLRRETQKPGNTLGIPSRSGSSGQTQLTRRFFYDPIYNQQCAVVERRGNSVDGTTYFAPQNGGTTPTNADRSRYATLTYFDYQKDTKSVVSGVPTLQSLLGLNQSQMQTLIDYVDGQMRATDGTGGLPDGFEMGLGDVNGDGTGVHTGVPAAYLGNVVKIRRPGVRQLVENGSGDPWRWDESTRSSTDVWLACAASHSGWAVNDTVRDNAGGSVIWQGTIQERGPDNRSFRVELSTGTYSSIVVATQGINNTTRTQTDDLTAKAWANEIVELFTYNKHGQVTTQTCPEGNLTVYLRHPYNDPEGDGRYVAGGLSAKQYGYVREVHKDADPADVMSLVGDDGDLGDFKKDIYPRNTRPATEGGYLDLVTRYEGAPGVGGCGCAYDASGNVTAETDARGFTTTYDRNEAGQVYRIASPGPYFYRKEIHYDAGGNVIREDTEDKVVAFVSDDPTSADYAKFLPTGSGATAHVPVKAGPGGALRPGWFTNLYAFDLLDNRVKEDLDATGSNPDRLVTTFEYDPNQNLVRATKPEGNIVEYDYDERNLRIAMRVGYVPAGSPGANNGAVTLWAYDSNGNLRHQIGPLDHNAYASNAYTRLTATLNDAFRTGQALPHTGDWVVENTYDGFDRVIKATDAVGGTAENLYDPDGRITQTIRKGTPGGTTPIDRSGGSNVTLAQTDTYYNEVGAVYETQSAVFLNTGKSGGNPTHNLPSTRTATHTGGGLEHNSTSNGHTGTVTLTTGGQSYVLSRNVYDRAGRLAMVAADNTAKTRFDYDGVGRQIKITDAQGQGITGMPNNVVETTYDGSGNATRIVRSEKAVLDPDSHPVTETFQSYLSYDALNRLVISADQGADGSTAPDPVAACVSGTSQAILTRIGYDSRGNRTLVTDPKGNTAIAVYDGAGRAVESVQHLREGGDGARPPEGGASFEPDGGASVRTRSVYDGNGRLTELIDDRGGTTRYAYDTLDRQVQMTFHDGSTRTTQYNAASDVVLYTDENGSVLSQVAVNAFDALGRVFGRTFSPAAGVAGPASTVRGTSAQNFQYDGLGRTTHAVDAARAAGESDFSATVNLFYDSLGRVVEEQQTHSLDGTAKNRYVTSTAFTALPPTALTFPDSRQVAYTYDMLGRRIQIVEGVGATNIAKWSFFGPSRVAEVALGNGLILTYLNNTRSKSAVQSPADIPAWGDRSSDRLGYDGAGRMICKRYLDAWPTPTGYTDGQDPTRAVVGFTTWFDLASNKIFERHLHANGGTGESPGRSHLYPAQDSLNRLREYQRGTLEQNPTTGVVSIPTPITLPGTISDRVYGLDGLGNWPRLTSTPAGSSQAATEVRQHNHVNQVIQFGAMPVLYDHGNNASSADPDVARRGNGNVADDGVRLYVYDTLNRMVQVKKKATGLVVATYTYDTMGRRVRKVVSNGGLTGDVPDGTTDYLYSGQQCVEERNPFGGQGGTTDTPLRQYVWGRYIDELVQQRDIDPTTQDSTYYYLLSDLLYRAVALMEAKSIVEVYDTDAYGNTLVFSAPATGGNWFADGASATNTPKCRFIFTGREFDPETQIYFYRARYYHPGLGRFGQEDLQYPAANVLMMLAHLESSALTQGLPRNDLAYRAMLKILLVNMGHVGLYEAFLSNPLRYTDSLGWAGDDVHITMTDDLAQKHGVPQPAGRPSWGEMDIGEDVKHPAHDPRYTQRHFRNPRDAWNDVVDAAANCDENAFATALHQMQDAVTHPAGGPVLGAIIHAILTVTGPIFGHDPDRPRYEGGELVDQSRSSWEAYVATDIAFSLWSAFCCWDGTQWVKRGGGD